MNKITLLKQCVLSGAVIFLFQGQAKTDSKSKNTADTPLFQAVLNGDLDSLKKLASDKNINSRNSSGRTLLHQAVLKQNQEITKWLLENKADVNALDHRNNSALHYLAHQIQFKPKNKTNQSILKLAELLLENKANPNIQNSFKETPLHTAGYSGDTAFVSLLLKYKADPNIQNTNKQNALISTLEGAKRFSLEKQKNILSKYNQTADLLLKSITDINAVDSRTYSALHLASESGFLEIAKKIINKKPNINLQTNQGWSALHLASGNNRLEIVQLLIQNNAQVNIKDKKGTTPLYFAVGAGSKKIVSVLLKSNAIVFFEDKVTGNSLFSAEKTSKLKNLIKKFKEHTTKTAKN